MGNYRRSSHAVYQLHYHFVFLTKYRKQVLRGETARRVRDLIREICRTNDIEILRGHVRPDHVHLLLSVPPHLSPSRVMHAIKGKTSAPFADGRETFAEGVLGVDICGARGYFVASSGNVTDEVLKEYIDKQDVEGQDDGFKISE